MKGFAATLIIAFVLMIGGSAWAQIDPPQKEESIPQRTNAEEIRAITEAQKVVPDIPAPNAESASKIKIKKMTGTVIAVDGVANTMTLKVKKNQVVFTVDPNAAIMWGGSSVKLLDIPKQGNVVVQYTMQGKMRWATAITEKPITAKNTMPPKPEAAKPPASPGAKP